MRLLLRLNFKFISAFSPNDGLDKEINFYIILN
jgi:hypothetical protein